MSRELAAFEQLREYIEGVCYGRFYEVQDFLYDWAQSEKPNPLIEADAEIVFLLSELTGQEQLNVVKKLVEFYRGE